jgi:glycosyltransferase involved in cell wall biosynthesis
MRPSPRDVGRSFVLDLQACQCVSRFRGIGRYSLAFARAFIAVAHRHEVSIFLNGAFPDATEALRADLGALLPSERIFVWAPSGPTAEADPANVGRRIAAERDRERVLAALRPDLVHVASLFEGFPDDAVTSIGETEGGPRTAATLYDLIPLVHRRYYLEPEGAAAAPMSDYYFRKLGYVQRADLVLAISEATRREAIDLLGLSPARVVNISTAADPMFRVLPESDIDAPALRARLQLDRPFVMYTGGPDRRKNIDTLIDAWAALAPAVRDAHQLLIVCALSPARQEQLLSRAAALGLPSSAVRLPGFVSDRELVALYNLAKVFVFPSWHEGFGLPVLEAMACGTAVLAANTSSLPEVVGRADALFDPHDTADISGAMQRVLTDADFRAALEQHGPARARSFTWPATAGRALVAFEDLCDRSGIRT